MKRIFVLGSVSLDLTVVSSYFPQNGETVFGEASYTSLGGKGANQAGAANKLGGNVSFFGAIGNDDNASFIKNALSLSKMNFQLFEKEGNSGLALIHMAKKERQNQITVISGANMKWDEADVSFALNEAKVGDILVLQNEIPSSIVSFALRQGKSKGMVTMLNPAPYRAIGEELFPYIDYLSPNETELSKLVDGDASIEEKMRELQGKGVKNVIVTLGDKGSICLSRKGFLHINAHKVKVVDVTAAGDAYIGGLAYMLSLEKDLEEALIFASACGSATVTKEGAFKSLPTLQEVKDILR